MNGPRATVRLQLHAGFTLDDARVQVPYYSALGVSHFYLSPVSCAVPGSSHGYDVTNPQRINPELGGAEAFQALASALHAHHMGILLDIVPNHMATHHHNRWWWDVLEHGPHSRYARWLDIDWRPSDPTLYGKVLAPFLGQDYTHSLAEGDVRLIYDEERGRFIITAGQTPFPVAKGTLAGADRTPEKVLEEYTPGSQRGRWRLHELLKRQHYRLCSWHCAADSINWRRFFEISGLIGVRVEEPEVFEAVHELPLRLYEQGLVDGLRIDHVDGLAQPLSYCRRLRQAMRDRRETGREPWLVIEKILAADEVLDQRWQVDGTTGYDFMDQAGALLHDPQAEPELIALWHGLSGQPDTAATYVHDARTLMLQHHFVAERRALVRSLHGLLRMFPRTSDWSLQEVDKALEALLVYFPVYRTYLNDQEASHQDALEIERAAAGAHHRLRNGSEANVLLDDIKALLLAGRDLSEQGSPDLELAHVQVPARREMIQRFEQLTPPLAAKSLEDTVFYRYGPLISRNEVGSDPSVFSLAPDDFHACNTRRASRHRASLLATATHDHKRGEDSRARLAVLSERVDDWKQACRLWTEWRRATPGMPCEGAERYMLWQAMIGAWPLELDIEDTGAVADFAARIVQWQTKALREAKLSSSWFAPDLEYERRSAQYVYESLGWKPVEAGVPKPDFRQGPAEGFMHDPDAGLLRSLHGFVQSIASAGAVNSLAQTVLRLTSPGIPDLYQGTEWWDYTLVDPDNRKAVDYEQRRKALTEIASSTALSAQHWRNGCIKQAVIQRILALRARDGDLFDLGAYEPLGVEGRRLNQVIAYQRCLEGQHVLVAVPRLCADGVRPDAGLEIDTIYWNDTSIMVPALQGWHMQDIFTGKKRSVPDDGRLPARDLFSDLPCAVLVAT